jgi:hypothetical protein
LDDDDEESKRYRLRFDEVAMWNVDGGGFKKIV